MAILWIFRACFTSLGSKHVGSLLLPPARDWGSSPCEWGLAAVGRFAFCMQQIPHLHLLYTPSCKVAHPFHKGDKSFLWKRQPKSPSVYAELKDLDFMQMDSVLIFLISLFKRQCNICSVCSSCLDHGRLLLLPRCAAPFQLVCGTVLSPNADHV